MTLVRFGCGCVGTQPNSDGYFIKLTDCRAEDAALSMTLCNTSQHIEPENLPGVVLDVTETIALWTTVRRCVRDGERLQTIRDLLEIPAKP